MNRSSVNLISIKSVMRVEFNDNGQMIVVDQEIFLVGSLFLKRI